MAYDKAGKGEFESEGKNKRRYRYEIDQWNKEDEFPRRRSGKRITQGDLPDVNFLTVKSTPVDEPDKAQYSTVWGPFDDWDFLEEYLAYDYGEEGSLGVSAT